MNKRTALFSILHIIIQIQTKTEISDHENIGINTGDSMYRYAHIDFSLMAALIKGFWVQGHTPDTPATLFYDEGGKPHQKMGSIHVALFT